MKILHISDIHGNLKALQSVVDFAQKRSDLEVIACTGDLLGVCMDEERAEKMHGAARYILNSIQRDIPIYFLESDQREGLYFGDLLKHILKDKNAPGKLKEAAEFYRTVEREFDIKSEFNYRDISRIIGGFPQQVITIPGNWDSQNYFKHFEKFDLHCNEKKIEGVSFAGYGDSADRPKFLPPTKGVGFSQEELYNFMNEAAPDVALTHVPPYGYCDIDGKGDHVGSFANAAYLFRTCPDLLLCGHIHEGRGKCKVDETGTVVVNPGNLGSFVEGGETSNTAGEIEFGDDINVRLVKID